MMEHGLHNNTYILRAQILSKIFKWQKSNFGEIYYYDCEIEIGGLCLNIFRDNPSVKEKAMCKICKKIERRKLVSISMEDTQFQQGNINDLIENCCSLSDTPCLNCVEEAEVKGLPIDILKNDPRVQHEIVNLGKIFV